jgi:hypothetical protein
LHRWFNIPIPEKEYQERRPAADLMCLTDAIKTRPLHEIAADLGAARAGAFRDRCAKSTPAECRKLLRAEWASLLGDPRLLEPAKPAPDVLSRSESPGDKFTVERVALGMEREITVPLLLLTPPRSGAKRVPVVVCLAQEGKKGFLDKRAAAIAGLIEAGVAVCLSDVRGTGETAPSDGSRGRTGAATAHSSTALMLDRDVAVPLDAVPIPDQAEPLGGLLAVFGALFRDQIRAVYVHGGLVGFQSVLESPFCYVPHDVIVPGALTAGDLCDVAGALAPRPLRLEGLVDGRNRLVAAEELKSSLEPTRKAYAGSPNALQFDADRSADDRLAQWLVMQLTTGK